VVDGPGIPGLKARLLPFVPYAVIALTHLGTLLVSDGPASTITKPFLMPALLAGLLWSLRPPISSLLIFAALGITFSFLGDVLFASPGDIGFLLGLGGFFLAHSAYLLLFTRPMRERRIPWFAGAYVLWWAVLVLCLAPSVGALLVPVAAYGLVLAASSAAALGAGRLAAIGALLFLVSDTLLAVKLFLPGWDFYPIDFIIMSLYVAAQGLIALAVASRGYRFRSRRDS
jgi:alkenylglycerophosphocholine/alkenylglycerophosphoethanolamine hydrolase